ncbi:hypothetical protein DHEL01_v212821 [Diaporthe helianthi]|uniref:HNH nuclease domain-containing protein n=1 Tax=Diaporthe helianthi TaxID=158607 RepID=A0A2P5HEV4_DIAHE|nr:hypothetical protein DHEL01_v212821 [Diaporthe helianthi]
MAASARPAIIRPPIAPVSTTTEFIRFLHPGYKKPNNVLFRLARVDAVDTGDQPAGTSNPPTLGVCHATALVACQVVANNAWSGRLALDKDGQTLVTAPLDHVLLLGEYYFIVDRSPVYPIVPSFRDWQFPHDDIPTFWPVFSAGHPSNSCILTNSSYAKTAAHLIPKEEGDWFRNNSMGQYGRDRKDTEDSANLTVLRADIHTWLDSRGWTIVPKENRYIAHVLDPARAPEFFSWFHNVELGLSGGSPATEYLFARFAWTVIQLVKPFVMSPSPRAVVRVQADPEEEVKWMVETLQPAQLDDLYGGGGSKSASPNKRKRNQSSAGNSSIYDDVDFGCDAETNRIYQRITEEEEARERWKRRRYSDINTNSSVYNDVGFSNDAEVNMIYQRITKEQEAREREERRRYSEITDDMLEQRERRGRSRTRRSRGTNAARSDHEDSTSPISTEASLAHDSFTTASPVELQEDSKLSTQAPRAPLDDSCTAVDVDGEKKCPELSVERQVTAQHTP